MDIIFVLAQQTESVTQPESLDYIPLRIVITSGIVVLLIAGAIFPKLKIDAFTLGLIVLAILPWLAPIISNVELPGGTKIALRLKKLEQETKSLAKRSEQNASKAQNATTQSQVALAAAKAGSSANQEETIDTLKKKYNEIREREASGPQRTADMTDIVGKMIAVVGGLTKFDTKTALASTDEGDHLVAVVYLYVHPNFEDLDELINNVKAEKQPFVQYWGVQAIGKILALQDHVPSIAQRKALLQLLDAVDSPDDRSRYYALKEIIRPFVPTVHIETESGTVTSDAKTAFQALAKSGYVMPDFDYPIDFPGGKANAIYYNALDQQASQEVTQILSTAGLGSLQRVPDARLSRGEMYVYLPD